ncbi:hypothetical protein [Bradyrhizobium murdochi]|uniref:hypothetical protein n=1 Tax=Bradyrhizobium murdochi TaxID=1038859 RepID=UPI0012EC676B|nr:hypothetical protein [Bradyrhizobium murdochi]
MLAGDTAFFEGDVLSVRKVLKRTLEPTSSTKRSVATVAMFKASMSGSAVELEEGSSKSVMNETPVEAQARHFFNTIDLKRFLADAFREQLVPALHRPVKSGLPAAHVLVPPRWQPRAPAFDDGLQQYTPVQTRQQRCLAERTFALTVGRALPTATYMSPAPGARR